MITLLNKIRYSKLRYTFWPITSSELMKFLPMAFLMLSILLIQNLLRSIKDGFVVTMISTEILSFIKLWGEMPFGVLFVLMYTGLCNIMTTEQVFRVVVWIFLMFFTLFAFVIYPNHVWFHPNQELIEGYIAAMPHMKWFIVMWSKWSFVLFYIIAELWPVVVFFLLFWQLANKITHIQEAKRFYVFFGLFGQTNLLMSGAIILYFSSYNHILMYFFDGIKESPEIVLKSLTIIVILCGVICLILHRFIEIKYVAPLKDSRNDDASKDILKLTLRQSAKMVCNSGYLVNICLLMICYSASVNLIEGLWFSRIKALYPETQDFMAYHGAVLFWTGIGTLVFIFIGSTIINKLGWFWAALMTPLMIMLSGGLFFLSVITEDYLNVIMPAVLSMTPLVFVVYIGGLQNILGKGVKYSLFDATKEITYIPLDNEMKTKGKAAVEVLGTKLGKAIGASTQMITFTIFPYANHEDIAFFLMIIFLITCGIWIYAVKLLNNKYMHFYKTTVNKKKKFAYEI